MDGGAGDADHTIRETIDGESGEILLVKGSIAGGDYEVVGQVVQSVFIRDRSGHQVCVTPDRRLHVVDSSGLPHLFTDAVGADAYAALGVVPHFTTRILFQVDTKDAFLSLDGGLTDHLFLGSLKGQMLLDGLAIEGGATISAKNAVGGQNYANLTVAVW